MISHVPDADVDLDKHLRDQAVVDAVFFGGVCPGVTVDGVYAAPDNDGDFGRPLHKVILSTGILSAVGDCMTRVSPNVQSYEWRGERDAGSLL